MVKGVFVFFLFLIPCDSKALSLEMILKANDAVSLKSLVKKDSQKAFLTSLCEKQKQNNKIPLACFELSLKADPFCLSLRIKHLDLEGLNKALQSDFLSLPCRQYLKKKQKILIYRQKDFLLPELKKHWTVQKTFP